MRTAEQLQRRTRGGGRAAAGLCGLAALAVLLAWASPARAEEAAREAAAEATAEAAAEATDVGESVGTPDTQKVPGERADVHSTVYIPARPESVWSVLTDYDHLRDFIPGLLESRLLEDHGSVKLIEQVGHGSWLFLGKKARVVLEVEERRPSRLEFHVVDGDFDVFDGAWELYPRQGGHATLLSYRLTVRPKFFAPGFAVKHVLRRDVPQRLMAIRDHVVSLNLPLAGAGAPSQPNGAAR
ncbi:MAG TPA: SRPBCC family protein [Candidatus Saccharimonadales bacterium]|nr:SRPBCC family protein [Candidatus Saccharimonadales bacterium]